MKLRKKGDFPTDLSDFVAYVSFVIVIIIALIVFNIQIKKIKADVQSVSAATSSDGFINNLLRIEVEYQDQGVREKAVLAELMALYYYDDDYETILKGKIKEIIDKYYGGESNWKLKIDSKEISEGSEKDQVLSAHAKLPVFYFPHKKMVDVNIYIYANVIEEGSWCINPAAQRCSKNGNLCQCDFGGYNLIWTNCIVCTNGCNENRNECN